MRCGERGGTLATMSNLNSSYLKLLLVELSQVELGLGFDNFVFLSGKLVVVDPPHPPPLVEFSTTILF